MVPQVTTKPKSIPWKMPHFTFGVWRRLGHSASSYNQPRRDQRQQIIRAARDLNMLVMPEGGATLMHNLTMIVDGHTGIEHTVPTEMIYGDVDFTTRQVSVGYTPTLSVAYGGLGVKTIGMRWMIYGVMNASCPSSLLKKSFHGLVAEVKAP